MNSSSQLPSLPELGGGPVGIAFGSAGGETEMYLGQSSFDGTTGVNVFAAGSCGNLECATLQQFWTGEEVPEERDRSKVWAGSRWIIRRARARGLGERRRVRHRPADDGVIRHL